MESCGLSPWGWGGWGVHRAAGEQAPASQVSVQDLVLLLHPCTESLSASWPATSQLAPSAPQYFCMTHMCDLKTEQKQEILNNDNDAHAGASGNLRTPPPEMLFYALWREAGADPAL